MTTHECRNAIMRAMQLSLFAFLVSGATARDAAGQSSETDSTTRIKFGGFLDTYYAFDFNRPALRDRAFTTQAARNNEFNVNLAFLDATLVADRLRGRIAIQFGTSVQANYASEPSIGAVSGSDVSQFLQEAVAGYNFTRALWVDAGVFLSSFGSENWTSRDNWTYTRSMVAENSPYYESGVKATWQVSRRLALQMHLINGWQNVSENNSDKALGFRVDYVPSARMSLSYDAFLGNEAFDSAGTSNRIWQEAIVTTGVGRQFQIRGTIDYGVQERTSSGADSWWGYSLIGRYSISRTIHAAARMERYADKDQIIVRTNLPYGFCATGWSLNTDFEPVPHLLARVEFRQLDGRKPLFPGTRRVFRRDRLAVASVALSF